MREFDAAKVLNYTPPVGWAKPEWATEFVRWWDANPGTRGEDKFAAAAAFLAGQFSVDFRVTAPIRAPTREITMQDVRLIAGEGKLDAATVLDAVNAHLRREAGRAPDGGDLVERLRSAARSWRRDDAEKARDLEAEASLWDEAADELTRLAASHAGDRERLEAAAWMAVGYLETGQDEGLRGVAVTLRSALAPAAGQDDAVKPQPSDG